jgi:hypothetical protein
MQLMADRRATDWRQSETLRLAVPVRDADSTNHARQVDDARQHVGFFFTPVPHVTLQLRQSFYAYRGRKLFPKLFPVELSPTRAPAP